MKNVKETLKRLEDNLCARGRSEETIKTFLSISESFLKQIKTKPTPADIDSFLAGLRRKEYADNSIRYNYYTLKRLFKIINIPFDSKPPQIKEENINQPTFSLKQTENIITNAKVSCNAQEKAFLAASTTWGLRRSEIIGIKKEDIKKNSILIKTKKSGIIRETTIPPQISKYITGYNWKSEISNSGMSLLFYKILNKCGIDVGELPPHSGWHCYRRSLVSELMRTGVKEGLILNFLRWRESGKSMLYRYTKIPSQEIDEEIYKVHPFLSYWE